jgi:REP element-mobilizing transposase RayT
MIFGVKMKRRFSPDSTMHVYQRSISGFNIFYSLDDFLVFYTIVAVQARKYGITLLGLCLMIDHIHLLMSATTLSAMSRFISSYTSIFVREFNQRTGRKGPLFKSAYGSAVKQELKKIRSVIAYLFNNPVEKLLCSRAEAYRWNFLAYHMSANPFSKPIGSPSRKLKMSMKIVDESVKNCRYLKYALIETIYKGLDHNEKEYLTDYIICAYFPFDSSRLISHFRSYEDMITAINSNTGNEYEISERHYCKSDTAYREIINCLRKHGIQDMKDCITFPIEKKIHYTGILKTKTSASYTQIRKFLHIPKEKRNT